MSGSLKQNTASFPAKLSSSQKLLSLNKRSLPINNPSKISQVDARKLYVPRNIPSSIVQSYGEDPDEIDDPDDNPTSYFNQYSGLPSLEFQLSGQSNLNILPSIEQQLGQLSPVVRKLPPNTVGFPIQISSHLRSILKEISEMTNYEPILGIEAPTGVGKSIGVPWIIVKHDPKQRVMVSVPTRANAVNLHRSMQKYDPTINVGFAADREINYNDTTNIIYATAGHVKNLLFNNIVDGLCDNITFADILIIDEIHIGSVDNDIVYSLWERCAQMVKVYPRLIITSAFIDPLKFQNIPKYTVSTKSYPVETLFHHKTFSVHNREMYLDLANKIKEYHLKEPEGHFLVFAPGKNEINKIIQQLKVIDDAIILPAYSNLERSDLDKIYGDTDKRKIIIATNVAETGLTIEDVIMVFDSLLEKRAETSSIGGLRLVTTKIAHSSAEQRRGRTGRTKPGKYYPMCTEEDFKRLEKTRPDEIERVPITGLIMRLVGVGLDPLTVIKKLTIEKKESAFNVLQNLKIIEYDKQYKVTEKGEFVNKFEMSIYNSSSLWDIKEQQISVPVLHSVVILVMIDMVDQTYFSFPNTPSDMTTSEFRLKYRSKFEKYLGSTDVHVFGNIWNDLMNRVGGLVPFTVEGNNVNTGKIWSIVMGWAQENSLNFRSIKEMIKSLFTVMSVMRREGFTFQTDLQSSIMNVDDVIDKIRPILAVNYDGFSMKLNDRSRNLNYPEYIRLETGITYKMNINSTMNKIVKLRPKWIIGLSTSETIDSNKFPLRFVNIYLDVEKFDFGLRNELDLLNRREKRREK